MLRLDGELFTIGRSTFLDDSPERPEPTAKIYVKILAGDLDIPFLAQLDTGAAWSCLDPELATAIGVLGIPGEETKLRVQGITFNGRLVPVTLHLIADEGESLAIEGTVFVTSAADWPSGWNVLGYGGVLDRIRSALDPQRNHFYFG